MSKAGDILNEADFDDEDMELLRKRSGEVLDSLEDLDNPATHALGVLLDQLASAGNYAKKVAYLIENPSERPVQNAALDELTLDVRNYAATIIELCDAVDDAAV